VQSFRAWFCRAIFFLVAMGDLVKKRFKESFSTSLDPIILADGE
jgi:hypothetical protein